MSSLSEFELARFRRVAEELRETFSERGYRVDAAMEVDPAFGSGRSRSALRRDLIVETTQEVASRVGLDFRQVKGGGRELRTLTGTTDRRFRMRAARRQSDGDLRVDSSSDSVFAQEENSLWWNEHWVFGWTIGDDDQLDEIFVAEVIGRVDGNPGYLVFGELHHLGGETPPSTGTFLPDDGPLPGFDDEDGAAEDDEPGSL